MKRYLLLCLLSPLFSKAQELFVYTEPASNMAAKSIGVRIDQSLVKDLHKGKGQTSYHLVPRVMWGISRKFMFHANAFTSNMDGRFNISGGSFYLKYRFLSSDDIHKHFRLAAYGQYSFNNSRIHEYSINLDGHNSGYEGGLIATKLVNKLALSASVSWMYASDNGKQKFRFGNQLRNAMGYSLSTGLLVLPKEYTSYRQTNLNLMVEFLGQVNAHNGYGWFDIAPSLQLIFNSRARLDFGYRIPLVKKLLRYSAEGALLRLEYNFYNIFNK